MNESPIIEWEKIVLPPEPPDAYHYRLKCGATRYGLEWLASEESRPPAASDCWWSVMDAWCWINGGRHWDGYSTETLVLAHSRLVGKIAAELCRTQPSEGADLFAVGLASIPGAVRSFEPDQLEDADVLVQLARYIGRAARNDMIDYLDKMRPPWWRNAKSLGRIEEGWDDEWKRRFGQHTFAPEHTPEKVMEIIKSLCDGDEPWIWECLLEWWTQDFTQAELAERFNVSRHQIQESLVRVLRLAETEFGLTARPAKRRSRRRGTG